MAQPTHGARSAHAGTSADHDDRHGGLDARDDGRHTGRTPAQWYCLLAGAALLLAGIFGFIADATFDAGNNLDGDSFLGFEVNGWHNVVHVLSGIVLLAAFSKRKPAKTVALAFGVVYGLVALIGLIDGSDVLGIIPVNGADNVLHLALSAAGILAALASPTDERRGRGHRSDADRVTTARTGDHDDGDEHARFDRDYDPLSGKPRHDDTITRNR
jgi:hypothetical protein